MRSHRPRGRAAALAALALLALAAACAAPRAGDGPRPLRPLRPDPLEWNGGERDADLVHLELDLAVDAAAGAVEGRATARFRALLDGTRALRLHAVGLEVAAVRDGAGRALPHALEEPFLRVELAAPLARGEELELVVEYRARPERGLHFVPADRAPHEPAAQVWSQGQEEHNRCWFPSWDLPNERFTYRGRFRVGPGLAAVSNGVLVAVEEHADGGRSFTWELERTLSSYLVALAVGRFERYEDVWRGVPVEYYVAAGTGEERARRAFGETPEMLEFFSELLGVPYPYPRYAQVAVAEFVNAGMENTTVSFQTDAVVVGADAALDLDGDPRLLVAHELAHQWFGDLVTCLRWSDLWLNEAWASYLELLFERERAGDGSFRAWLERYRERYLARGAAAALPVAEDWRAQVSSERAHHLYDKGPWVLHMLRAELGDVAFWQATRDYLQRHAEGLVTTADFWRAVFDSTGRNVEGFLEQWVEGAGHPVLAVRFEADAAAGELALDVRQVQPLSELVPLFDVPLDLDLHLASGAVRRERVRVAAARQELLLPLPEPLVDLVVDPDCALLCELALDKPPAMWAHQAALAHAGVRWRALAPLAAADGGRAGREVARAAHLAALRHDPVDLVRARAVELWRARGEPDVLLERALEDPSARVRRLALLGLDVRALTPAQAGALEARLASERSPAARGAIEALLAAWRAARVRR